jgi:hypothetical protein
MCICLSLTCRYINLFDETIEPRDVTAAMLVFQFKRILIRFFCLKHQHGRHGFCWVGPWGMSVNALFRHFWMAVVSVKTTTNSCARFTAKPRRLPCTLTNFGLVQILMRVDESFCHARGNIKSTLINSHVTLVLVWPGHESWENSHANSRFSTFINSHATLVLVWPGHASWENSHANSRLPVKLVNSHRLSSTPAGVRHIA